jgi:hypothetical protein
MVLVRLFSENAFLVRVTYLSRATAWGLPVWVERSGAKGGRIAGPRTIARSRTLCGRRAMSKLVEPSSRVRVMKAKPIDAPVASAAIGSHRLPIVDAHDVAEVCELFRACVFEDEEMPSVLGDVEVGAFEPLVSVKATAGIDQALCGPSSRRSQRTGRRQGA